LFDFIMYILIHIVHIVRTYWWFYKYVYVWMQSGMYVSMIVYVYMYTCMWLSGCMHVCIIVCMYLYIYLYFGSDIHCSHVLLSLHYHACIFISNEIATLRYEMWCILLLIPVLTMIVILTSSRSSFAEEI
jgi:hypothetical protein